MTQATDDQTVTPSEAAAPAGFGPAALLQGGALIQNPYPLYAALRATQPVLRVPIPGDEGAGVWILTRHAEVEHVLRDTDGQFSVDRLQSDIAHQFPNRLPRSLIEGPGAGLRTMLLMDPPDHTRIRGLVSKAFTPRRIEALRPRIEALVDELLAGAQRDGHFDVIKDFAEPLPAIVIAELLGVPPEDHRRFKEWSSALIQAIPESVAAGGGAGLETAVAPILDYMRDVIAARRAEPRDDLISGMIAAQEERDALTDAELVSTSFLLLIAGHETTTNLVGNGLLALLRSPDQWDRLRAEPGLVDGAIEEMLRYDSPVQATVRVATAPVTLGDFEVGKGALVVTGIGAANRDPARYPEPDRFDVTREDTRHLSFGFGTHFCLGAPMARLEGRLAFAGLLERFASLKLATDEVPFRSNPVLRGLNSLPVTVA